METRCYVSTDQTQPLGGVVVFEFTLREKKNIAAVKSKLLKDSPPSSQVK